MNQSNLDNDWPEEWPRPGEIYNTGKVEYNPYRKPTIPGIKGHAIVTGVGGEADDICEFKRLWETSGIGFIKGRRSGKYQWPLVSYKFGFVDFGEKGEFIEYIGTYPRKMLLLL